MSKEQHWGDIDALSAKAVRLGRGRGVPVQQRLRGVLDEEQAELVAEAMGQLRHMVLVWAVQEVVCLPCAELWLERVRYLGEHGAPRRQSAAWVAEVVQDLAQELAPHQVQEVRMLATSVQREVLGAMWEWVREGINDRRQLARCIILARYGGMCEDSWETLSTRLHVSERVLRRELRACGLPTNRV